MIRTHGAGRRALVVGLAAALIGAGSAAAATPVILLEVHARLAPVAGTKAAGQFDGGLVRTGGGTLHATSAVPRSGLEWRLTWRLQLPKLRRPMAASLRIAGANGAAPVKQVLCKQCAARARGTITLGNGQALRIAQSHAVVVVHTADATLRGKVTVLVHDPIVKQG